MPSLAWHPYRGLWAAVATMHGKERALAPPLCQWFGMTVTTVPGIDTDALGTFTGEIARKGTMLDAARVKARLALERTGAHFGIGSEGAFGPDPLCPFIAAGRELIVMIEAASGHEIVVHRRTPTNFDHVTTAPGDDIEAFLKRAGFPAHALIARPEVVLSGEIVKGVRDPRTLDTALARLATLSPDGRVRLETDMRAHLNPTRMTAINRTARWLALRVARCCPACDTPGFGLIDVERGLPCSACGEPTRLITAEKHGCGACKFSMRRRIRPAGLRAEPMCCQECNP
jgi:hypothetical protein